MFVGGLHPSVTQTDIYNFFSQFGNVLKVKIVGEAKGRSRGFGFVHFETYDTLERVCGMKSLEIGGREIDCKVANSELGQPPRNDEEEDPGKISKVFIKNVPLFIKKSEIENHYSRFGKIKEVLLIVRPNKNKAFSYVKFFHHEDACLAVQQLQQIREGVFLSGVLALPRSSKKLQELHRNYAKYAYNIEYPENQYINVRYLKIFLNLKKK